MSKLASAGNMNSNLNRRDSRWARSCTTDMLMGGPGGASIAIASSALGTKK